MVDPTTGEAVPATEVNPGDELVMTYDENKTAFVTTKTHSQNGVIVEVELASGRRRWTSGWPSAPVG